MNKLLGVLLLWSIFLPAKPAPQFTGKLMSGQRTSLKETLKPGRFLFLSFWASWCEPCLAELKEVKKLRAEFPSLPLDVLTINVDTAQSASQVKPIFKLQGFDFPVILDPKHEIFERFSSERSLPISFLIDDKGEVIIPFSGYSEGMTMEIRKKVEAKTKGSI